MRTGRRVTATSCALAVAGGLLASVAAPGASGAPGVAGVSGAADVPRDGLVAEYLFGETAGTRVASTADGDTSAGDPLDAVLRQGSDALWSDGSLGFTGGAKSAGSWVELPPDLLAGEQRTTISTELWADPAMLRGFHFLWNIGAESTDEYLFASLNCANGRRPLVGVRDAGREQLVQARDCAVSAERWTNLTVTVDPVAGVASVYVDGREVGSGPMTAGPAQVLDQTLDTIGRAPWPDPLFRGRVGAFRVWDRSLSASEVAAVSDADATEHADELRAAAETLVAGLGDRTVDGDVTLPTRGGTVRWSSADPAVIAEDGTVVQPARGADPVVVELTARAEVRGQEATTTVRYTVEPEADPEEPYGYAMVHFVEDSQGYAEKIYLDVSRGDDPTHWLPLNDGEPILASNLGTTGVRDPYLTRNPETGTWYVIATDLRVFGGDDAGWGAWSSRGSRVLNVWESDDLVDWGPLRQVRVAPPEAGMAWAPEATWDPELGEFVVYWASTLWPDTDPNRTGGSYSRILYGTTSDFTQDTFDYQGVMIDEPGSDVIDTTVLRDGATTYRLSKDNGSTNKGIYLESTEAADWYRPGTAWTEVQRGIGRADHGAVEGPALFKDHARDHWYLYVDVIPQIGYRPYETTDLDDGFTRLDSEDFTMRPSTKHGGVVSLTKAEHEALRLSDVAAVTEDEVSVSTQVGVEPELPATTGVALYSGRADRAPVVWDEPDPSAYDEPGTVQVEGRVAAIGNNLNAATGVGQPLTSSTAIDESVTATVTVTGDASPPRAVREPAVTGTPVVGRTLTADAGEWDPADAALTVRWLRDGRAIPGADDLRHRVTAADVGHRLAVRVTADASGSTGRADSPATPAVRRATPTVRLTPSASRVPAGGRVRVTVAVAARGLVPAGEVRLTDGRGQTRTARLRDGVATITLVARGAGRQTWRARYAGSPSTAPATGTTVVTVR